jgi:alpha-galactosidase
LISQKIVLIGAGSLQFGLGNVGNILQSEILTGSTICLHDINEKLLEFTSKACQSAIEKRNLDFKLESTTDRHEALKNANFIINSIEIPPRFKLLDMDFRIPQYYGCKQITGENGGPGAFFHSLRVIPPILDICADIQKICPNAFVINFSNPMTRICLAINRKFPSIKLVGLCHEYQDFLPILTQMLNIPINDLEIKAGGFNHFGVILEIKDKNTNQDLYPKIRKKGPKFLRSIERGPVLDNGYDLIAFILETYNYIPYTTDSHYGEYMQWGWEQANIHAVREFMESYKLGLQFQFKQQKRLIDNGKGYKVVQPDEENAIPIIEAILTDSKNIEPSVNIPNENIITNITKDAFIECPAIISKNGAKGIRLGEYPIGLAALLRKQYSVQDLTVEAILKRSKNLALQALLADPVIETYWQAKHILDEMLIKQEKYIQIQLDW